MLIEQAAVKQGRGVAPVDPFAAVGSARHALANGHIRSLDELAHWSPTRLMKVLKLRRAEIRRIELMLANDGRQLRPDCEQDRAIFR